MKYGISIQKNRVKVFKRIIIPGLSPTQVAAGVQFGMGRPEWIKYICTAGAHHNLDLSKPADRCNLVHNEEWGLLFQALTWKREAYEENESSAGYGIGFNQLESSRETSYGVLQQDVSATKLCEDIFNDIMAHLRSEELDKCVRLFCSAFSYPLDKVKVQRRLAELSKAPLGERKRGITRLFVEAINETLDAKFGKRTPDLLTIPLYFINMMQDMSAYKWPNDNKVLSVLYAEKPGEVQRGLSNIEIAAMIHELLKGENVRPIVLSFAVFDLTRGEADFGSIESMDDILINSFDMLPEDHMIAEYVQDLFAKIVSLLEGLVPSSSLMTMSTFMKYLSIESIKKQAVFWEYNLVLGELEEMLRKFLDTTEQPPYSIRFEKRWDDLYEENKEYWKKVVFRFQDLCHGVSNNDCYVSALKGRLGFRYDLQGWFGAVCQDNFSGSDLKGTFRKLLRIASEIGDSTEFDGKQIKVLFLPTPINPLITRDAIYSWLRIFVNLWK